MSYTASDLLPYIKNPNLITSDLDRELILSLVDHNAELMRYIKPQTMDLIQDAFNRDPSIFRYIDFSVVTTQFIEYVISLYPMFIEYLYYPSIDIMKLALSKDLNVLPYIEKYLDTGMYEWLVSKNGLVLEFIPAGKQTEKIVLLALHENVNSYQYAHVKTKATDILLIEKDETKIPWVSNYWPEIMEASIRYNPRLITKFYNDTQPLSTDMLKLAITGEPEIFKTIPNPDMEIMKFTIDKKLSMFEYMPYSQELIDYAIMTNGLALQYIRKKDLRTIKNAITQNVKALDFIKYPRKFLIDYAFSLNGYALKYIENPTYDQCLDAVRRNPYAIEFVPKNIITSELQLYALMGGIEVIPFIGEPVNEEVLLQLLSMEPGYIFKIENPTSKMLETAFTTEGRLIMFYPEWESFDYSVIEKALFNDGTIFEFVKNKTKKLALVAIEQYPPALQWTVGLQDLEMAKLAVSKDPRTIFFVEKHILDTDLLDLALSMDPEYFTRELGSFTWTQWLEIINK